MPESYEEAIEDKQRETPEDEEHLEGMPNYSRETRPGIDVEELEEKFEDVEDIVVSVPDFLKGEEGTGDIDFPGQRRPIDLPEIIQELPGLQQQLAIDIRNMDNMGVEGLLRIMARISVIDLITQLDIADAVAPVDSITVSGTNSTDEANQEEPVIPRADETQIPTKKLFIKASRDNDKVIWFGDDDVRPNSGFTLAPGESIIYPIDFRREVLWMSSTETGQTVELLGAI